jgi:hypothetical protein
MAAHWILDRRCIYLCVVDFVSVHRDGKRFIVRADEKLTAFVELQSAIHEFAVSLVS